jgi:putative inorganic carbon (hco3(-)) transporter
MNTVSNWSLKVIRFSFGLLFFLLPLTFYPLTKFFPFPWVLFGIDPLTYELFEYNKMFLVYGVTIIIATAWGLRCFAEGRFLLKRSFMDYPILFFLVSQIISTIVSIDPHTSWWGYYSRFHGGLVSTICYCVLYMAFVTHCLDRKLVFRYTQTIILSATLVGAYGIAQHYGIDAQYWVQNVRARVFSSLGQPNWLAAYLIAVLPLGLTFFIFEKRVLFKLVYFASVFILFLSFLFTASRSGLLAFVLSMMTFSVLLFVRKSTRWSAGLRKPALYSALGLVGSTLLYLFIYYEFPTFAVTASILFILLSLGLVTFSIEKRSQKWLAGLTVVLVVSAFLYSSADTFRFGKTGVASGESDPIPQEAGGTETGKIRFIVWNGALEVAKHYPIFGSGVETFAYSFYKYRPVELLNTTEWDFLYNKAHNEYLNILATTGIFGLGVYLYYIVNFGIFSLRNYFELLRKSEDASMEEPVQIQISKKNITIDKTTAPWESSYFVFLLISAVIAGMVSILITNFFGFSVVVIGIFFFLFPAIIAGVTTLDHPSFNLRVLLRSVLSKLRFTNNRLPRILTVISYCVVLFTGIFFFVTLVKFWFADVAFAEARSFNKFGKVGKAYPLFTRAYALRPGEPFYLSELGWTQGNIVHSLIDQNESSQAAEYAPGAEHFGMRAVEISPNNVNYWKKLADIYYQLSFYDKPKYADKLKRAADRTRTLAPTDASILLILSEYYERVGEWGLAIDIVKQSLTWKPDLADGWFRLGEIYNSKYKESKEDADVNMAQEYLLKAQQLDPVNEVYKKGYE